MKIFAIILFAARITILLANEVEFYNTTCLGSEVIELKVCETSKDTFWVEIFIKRPLNNFFVSFDRNLEPRGVDCV
jgi:hypothetical protein